MKHQKWALSLLICAIFFASAIIFQKAAISAPNPNPEVEQQRLDNLEKAKQIETRIKAIEAVVEVPEEAAKTAEEAPEEPHFLVEKITVTGNSVIPDATIREIVSPSEGKELTLTEAKALAKKITALYRSKGYITTIAYVPAQNLNEKTLEIKVLEGKLNNVSVQGNKYFKAENILRPVKKLIGKVLEYGKLKKSVIEINAHPDREVKAVVLPGQTVGTSDLILEAKDHFPLHVGAEVNNFGTRLTGMERYGVSLTDNNLFGADDILAMRLQYGEKVQAISTQYVRPLDDDGLELGGTFSYTEVGVGGDFVDLDIKGKASAYSVYLDRPLMTMGPVDFKWTGGFESKSIENTVLGVISSKDELRMLHAGLNLDEADSWGRTIAVNDLTYGFSWLGASEKNDPQLSRAGSGAGFMKFNSTVYRIQPIHDSMLLYLKTFGQWTRDRLLSAEQFDIGGVYSVRGYPQSDYLGDAGIGANVELRIPFYFISREIKFPGTDVPLWNRLNFVLFFDAAHASLRNPAAGEVRSKSYMGAGGGIRFALPHNMTGRFEWAAPIGEKPSDRSRGQFYFSVTVEF